MITYFDNQTLDSIITVVEWYYNTQIRNCKRRHRENVRARDAVIYFATKYKVATSPVIGAHLGPIDHSSVIAARHRIAARIEPMRNGYIQDRLFIKELEELEQIIGGYIA